MHTASDPTSVMHTPMDHSSTVHTAPPPMHAHTTGSQVDRAHTTGCQVDHAHTTGSQVEYAHHWISSQPCTHTTGHMAQIFFDPHLQRPCRGVWDDAAAQWQCDADVRLKKIKIHFALLLLYHKCIHHKCICISTAHCITLAVTDCTQCHTVLCTT